MNAAAKTAPMLNANPVWTPDTDPASLPRADRYDLGPSRVYFFDLDTRKELADHPLNGMCWTSSGAMVAYLGQYVDGTAGMVGGAAYLDGKPRRVRVTAASFPGRRVVAKVWCGADDVEWRLLAEGDGSEVKTRERFDGKQWAAMYKRGEVK